MRRRLLAALAALSTLGLLAGCGNTSLSTTEGQPTSSASTSLAPVEADQALFDKLPQKIKDSKVITVGVDATYKPNEYLDADGKTVIGMDVDLFDAVAARMGVKTQWQPSAFDQILIGITAKKYDVGVSSFTINDKRKQSVNMVSYLSAGTLWATATGNPKKVDAKNPCGQTIAVQTGTVQDDELKEAQKKCGDNKINVLSFADQGEVNNALMTGRAAAMLADSPITNFAIKQSEGKLEALGEVYDAAPYGIVVPKAQTDFAAAVAQALKDLKASGHYDAILLKWGQEKAAIDAFEVNP